MLDIRFAITLTFLVVYLQATEIFPTQLRSTGSGFASTMGSIIGIFTPYIVYLVSDILPKLQKIIRDYVSVTHAITCDLFIISTVKIQSRSSLVRAPTYIHTYSNMYIKKYNITI